MDDKYLIHHRKVCLKKLQSSPSQAEKACTALSSIRGMINADPISECRIKLSYSLEHLSFNLIEELLEELGFHLDRSLLPTIRRMVYQYLEDNAREHLSFEEGEDEQNLVCKIDHPVSHEEPEKYWTNYR